MSFWLIYILSKLQMKKIYVVETPTGVRAECNTREDAYSQAIEYRYNYGWNIRLYDYIIENPEVYYQVDHWELEFYIDWDPIYMEQREENWIWRWLLDKRIEKG